MSTKYLDTNGLLYVWSKIKTYFAGFIGTTTPSMDGTASTGSSSKYAREDHVHPTDSSRAQTVHVSSTFAYGKGTNYYAGHVKLSDTTEGTAAAADDGTAATPKAVSDALAAAKAYTDLVDPGVTDVKVNNTSVVTSGVANIDLTGKVNTSSVGAASGVCPLNSSSKIDTQYLPSYVDDVVEAYPVGSTELASDWLAVTDGGTPFTPETGKIYVLMAASTSYSANTQFRWGGTAYVKLSDGGVTAITNAEIDAIFAS